MLPIEDRAAAVPELESVQIWWHRWLGCGIGMGFSGWESLWQAADEALQLLPETLPASTILLLSFDVKYNGEKDMSITINGIRNRLPALRLLIPTIMIPFII